MIRIRRKWLYLNSNSDLNLNSNLKLSNLNKRGLTWVTTILIPCTRHIWIPQWFCATKWGEKSNEAVPWQSPSALRHLIQSNVCKRVPVKRFNTSAHPKKFSTPPLLFSMPSPLSFLISDPLSHPKVLGVPSGGPEVLRSIRSTWQNKKAANKHWAKSYQRSYSKLI